jgi:hypothetical protein
MGSIFLVVSIDSLKKFVDTIIVAVPEISNSMPNQTILFSSLSLLLFAG